ncbi:ribosomal RNA-processing protein 17 [Nasonia vitripennis]|uniref:Nucleolar protein 12 n=1 Tax=Nasonia vitripennis TaxID=7425 RepID=A0A7M7M2R1_NASVI|nr:ribosomal RNA-processing protein 17 [Nasonia vitripennis]
MRQNVEIRNKKQNKYRHNKKMLFFDEEKRKDFLGGFHKRKLWRRKKANEDMKEKLKIEKGKIKQKAQESYQNLLSHSLHPKFKMDCQKKVEVDGKKVSILEINISNIETQPVFVDKILPKRHNVEITQQTGVKKYYNSKSIKQ